MTLIVSLFTLAGLLIKHMATEWTSVPIQPLLLKLVGRMTNRVFIGLPLCRDQKWFDTVSGHAHNGNSLSSSQ
jgi:hypothetical protein